MLFCIFQRELNSVVSIFMLIKNLTDTMADHFCVSLLEEVPLNGIANVFSN